MGERPEILGGVGWSLGAQGPSGDRPVTVRDPKRTLNSALNSLTTDPRPRRVLSRPPIFYRGRALWTVSRVPRPDSPSPPSSGDPSSHGERGETGGQRLPVVARDDSLRGRTLCGHKERLLVPRGWTGRTGRFEGRRGGRIQNGVSVDQQSCLVRVDSPNCLYV